MVIVDIKGNQFWIDTKVHQALTIVKEKVIKNDEMFVCIADGRHGVGKSTLIQQLAYYCSNGNLTLNDIVFTASQFIEKLNNVQPGGNIILDEGFDSVNKRTTRSGDNMYVLSLMQKMRAKKAFIWIVLPSFYDLDKNIILSVADLLMHCWRKDFGKRGTYSVYDRKRMKYLWLKCRMFYNYPTNIIRPNLRGCRFNDWWAVDKEEYQTKKMQSFEDMQNEKKKKVSLGIKKYTKQRNQLLYYIYKNKFANIKEISEELGLTHQSVSAAIKKYKIEIGDKNEL